MVGKKWFASRSGSLPGELRYVKQICEAAGVRIEYIPPYSPDLSPIEESFSTLKAWIRRNRKIGQELLSFYELFLHLAIA